MGRTPHVPKEKPKPPTEAEILSEALSEEVKSLEDEANRLLKPEQVKTLKKLAYYVGVVGMELSESCMLLDVDFDKFQEDMKNTPIIRKIITLKMLQYKKDLMATLSARAKAGDDKLALTLLERRYPEEFGEKKKPKDSDGTDLLQDTLLFIRQHANTRPLVDNQNSRTVVVTQRTTNGPIEKIGDILGNHDPHRFTSSAPIPVQHTEIK